MVHTDRDGNKTKLCDLKTDHLINIIKYIERKAEKGLIVCSGGGGWDVDEMWYDEDFIEGEEVLEYMDYKKYVKELNNRTNNRRIR